MNHTSYYKRVNINGRRHCHGSSSSRGFRLKYSKRFSVQGLRARFVYLFRLLSRWRFSYGQALKSLKKGIISRNSSHKNNYSSYSIKRNNSSSSSRRGLVTMDLQQNTSSSSVSRSAAECRMRSFARSNSFYAEAIADCLEFIKRSSISVDQNPVSCQR